MSLFLRMFPLTILALSGIASGAYGETCDISNFKDDMDYKKDISTNLAYINDISSKEDRSKQDNANLSVQDYGSFTYGDASKFSSSLERILHITWSQEDKEWLLLKSLTDKGLQAYKLCMQNTQVPVVVEISDVAGVSDEFSVAYTYDPRNDPDAVENGKFTATLINLKATDFPKNVKKGASGSFKVTRIDKFKPVEIRVQIAGRAAPIITLPADPTKELQTQISD